MPFFITLRYVQTLSDPKVIDKIKKDLFGETTIIRKIILEGGLVVVVDDDSGSCAPLTIFETTNHYDYDHTGYTDFFTSSECSACKCQNFKEKHDGLINAINALTFSVKKMTSKRGVIPSKRIPYPYTPLEIKVAKRRMKENFKASSSIEKSKITTPLSRSCIFDQCTRAIGDQYELKKIIYCISVIISVAISGFPMDVIVEATNEQHNITVVNQSTTSMEEEKVDPVSLGEWKNYPFEGFNNSNEALKKLTKLINDYLEWIVDGMLKHHTDRFCQQQPEVSQTEECLINIIKGFRISVVLPWHLVEEVYIPLNYGDELHWVLAVVVLKERRIRVYDSMMGKRRSAPSLQIQKLAKMLPTYLDISGFLNQKIRTNWSTIEAYWDKMGNLFDAEYVERIDQQTIGSW
ncbi:hypothetical protein T459_27802 [Capsicum annuum]|uniref:Ubiquitin-like protease family profile domain-containing protein n=1 Tax=Capsicum annuum TaxID=4072 RepID=A0A2G2YF19_CAPAN|nr:hypothetical protein T459_27802 [Capsicum annuum]